MNPGTVVALLAAAAALAFVVAPMLRKDAAEAERLSSAKSEAQELLSRKEMILSSLKDLEDDRETGKLADDDYRQLKDELSGQAVQIMKKIDDLEAVGSGSGS